MTISQAHDFKLLINGEAVPGASSFEVFNPATEALVAIAPAADRAQLDDAVTAARQAFPGWRSRPIAERQAMVGAMAAAMVEHVEELKTLLTAEQGKPLDAAAIDVFGGAHFCAEAAKLTPPVEVHEDSAERRVETVRVPLGVVCAIAPWNVPITLAFWKVGLALVAGNTVVLKPSPFTPLSTLRIGELVRGLLPPGVLNIISGGDELGPWMTSHPGFDKISFTGSTATGRRVMQSASATLKRLTLELGGNDAAIVLPGADIDAAARGVFQAAFTNSGQMCVAAKRVYVHNDLYDAFAQALVTLGRAARIGDGAEPGVMFGPINNRPQYDRVKNLIADSRANGHVFLLGDNAPVPDKGFFIPLTIIDNPPSEARIVVEEQFGPIIPLLRYDDVDTVIALANASDYGLAGSVWGPAAEALEVARQLDTGTVWINEIHTVAPGQPFGGHKQSGMGVENGLAGLLEYTSVQTIVAAKVSASA